MYVCTARPRVQYRGLRQIDYVNQNMACGCVMNGEMGEYNTEYNVFTYKYNYGYTYPYAHFDDQRDLFLFCAYLPYVRCMYLYPFISNLIFSFASTYIHTYVHTE